MKPPPHRLVAERQASTTAEIGGGRSDTLRAVRSAITRLTLLAWGMAAWGIIGCHGHAPCEAPITAAAAATCESVFHLTHDPRLGARVAAAMAGAGAEPALIELIARTVGDLPGGAGAWSAFGDAMRARDSPRAAELYLRAFAHRDAEDLRGRVIDARALYRTYAAANAYTDALHYAAIAYELSAGLDDTELRGRVLTGVTALLYDIGALSAAEAVMVEADAIVREPPPSWQSPPGCRSTTTPAGSGHPSARCTGSSSWRTAGSRWPPASSSGCSRSPASAGSPTSRMTR